MKRILAVWLAVALTATLLEAAPNISPYTPKLRSRATPSDSAWIQGGVIHFEQMDSAIAVTIRVSDKIIVDTVYGSGGDITRILGTMFSDTVRVGGKMRFGWGGYSIYLDSARVDSLWQQIGRFAPGGAGSGDIEGVTAGSGLTGGGITGTVTLNVLVGWGLKIDNDSVKVDMQALLDSIVSSGAADSNAQVYSADRYQSYSGTGSLVIGNDGDSTFIVVDSLENYAIVWANWYVGVEDPDSITMLTKHWMQSMVHDTLDANGFLTGLNSTNGITGGASMGIATLQIDWPWLRTFIDTCTATLPHATLADSTSGGAARATRAAVADSSVKGDTATTVQWAEMRTEIKSGAENYNKIDTTTAKIPTANVADTSRDVNKYGADPLYITQVGTGPITLQAADGSIDLFADQNTGAGTTGRILLYVGESITSSLKVDSGGVTLGSNDKLNMGGVTYYNLAGNALSVGVSANHALDVVAGTSTGLAVNADSVYVTTIPDIKIATTLMRDSEWNDSIAAARTVNSAWTLSGDWVNTANPWADNEVANNLTVDDAGIASTIARDSEITAAINALVNVYFGLADFDNTTIDTSAAGKLQVKAIDSTKITDGSIGSGDIGTGRITTTHVLDGTIALADHASNSVDSTKIVDGSVGSGDIGTGRITTTHVLDNTLAAADIATGGVATAEILDQTIGTADVDSTDDFAMTRARVYNQIYCNQIETESAGVSISIGSGSAGLTISSELLFGSDITDDSLVDLYIPEDLAMVVTRGWSTADIAYNDSIVIRGNPVPDSTEGNAIRFNDSTLTSGNHRRHLHLEVDVPPDCDSLRRVIIRCKSRTYSAGATEFFTVARLSRRPFTWSLVDSAIGGSMLDKDSSAAASATDITLGSNWTVTRHTSLYLLLSGRRAAGTAYNYADIYEVRFIWHRTGL